MLLSLLLDFKIPAERNLCHHSLALRAASLAHHSPCAKVLVLSTMTDRVAYGSVWEPEGSRPTCGLPHNWARALLRLSLYTLAVGRRVFDF